jgi:replicative DNA helicase
MVQSIDDTRRRQQRVGRVPPHNLEAEESLLGAMLLSGDAIASAVNIHLSTEDFYKPAHGHVFDAICTLYAQGEPVDPVTVAEELRRAGLHDLVGGLPALLSLEARTPATSNAARYARIVEDHALLRRLIGVAGEIAELGYDLPEDVAMAIDRAEAMVYEVAQKRVTDSMMGIAPLLEQSLDHIEALYERGEEITGIPTGFTDLDGILAGLQPSNLVIVGARPAAGKTSWALGVASHAAMQAHRPVLVFSLEMSHLELTQRLLCAEARVDASRLRTGRLQEPDWPKISHAVGRLGEANIFIDDNPHLTIMEIRAKARRLKSRLGDLGLIVVDYLQLMTGRPDAENRQVEVSEISRGLKILARELECPVIGLSQLSRQLETRADKRPMLADLRESGCLTADSRVLRADTGAEVTMGELLLSGETDIPVWSLDADLQLVKSTMTHVFPSGIKSVFDLRLSSGRVVRASANHPFLTLDGWTRLDELAVGSRVAVPRQVPNPERTQTWPEAELVMLAHLLGDGCVAPRQPVHYTSSDLENVEAVEDAAAHFGITPRRVRQKNWWHVYLPAPYHVTHGRRNPIQAWLSRFGLDHLRSYEKFLPREVFSLEDDQVALFLRHLWATDGSLGFFAEQGRISYASSSERLVRDVQLLLLRFEILTSIHRIDQTPHRPGYQLHVVGAENQRRFLDRIGIHGARAAYVPKLRAHVEQVAKHPYSDSIPVEVWDQVRPVASMAGLSARKVAAAAEFARGDPYECAPSRDRLKRVATLLDDENLRRIATSDVSWDHVASIEPVGEEPVYDATVVGTHNFVANGIVVENSLEQDADVVLFIYRDELYNPESADRGTAEIIVAKHRNGPTGTVQLAFVDRYTLFANMAKGV